MKSRSNFNSPLLKSLFIIYTLLPSKMNLKEIKWQTHHRASYHYLNDSFSVSLIPAEVLIVKMLILVTGQKEHSKKN